MAEFEVAGNNYRSAKLNARQQWNIARRLAPLLAAAGDMLKLVDGPVPMEKGGDPFAALAPLAEAMAQLNDEQSDYILDTCLRAVSRQVGDRWNPIMSGGVAMYDDIDMAAMLQITWHVLQESLGRFLGDLRGMSRFPAAASPPA